MYDCKEMVLLDLYTVKANNCGLKKLWNIYTTESGSPIKIIRIVTINKMICFNTESNVGPSLREKKPRIPKKMNKN